MVKRTSLANFPREASPHWGDAEFLKEGAQMLLFLSCAKQGLGTLPGGPAWGAA